jgi:capsular polysaccharide biosynthesis protein
MPQNGGVGKHIMETRERENQRIDNGEVDLREVGAALGRWKYTIITFTLICMLLSWLVSCFYLKPVYEAKIDVGLASLSQPAGLMNNNYIINDDFAYSSVKIMDELDELAHFDAAQYKQLVTSAVVLQRTIDQLSLKYKTDELKGKIHIIDTGENQNMDPNRNNAVIDITVDAETSELASNIANSLINESILYLEEIKQSKMDRLRQTLETQIAAVNQAYASSFTNLKEYQMQSVPAGSAAEQRAAELKKEIETNRLESEVKRNEEFANILNGEIMELELFKSLNSAKNQVNVVSPAAASNSPIKPNKMLNIVCAGVLGLMLAVMGVLILEYLRTKKYCETENSQPISSNL